MLVGFSKLGSLQPLRSVARMAQIAFRCACVWMALAAPVLAQVPEEETPEKTYVPCYLIIFFGVSLGLMMICRAGKRTLDFRRPD